MPIDRCEHCGLDIVAPRDVLVWAEEHTYHQACYQVFLEDRISHEINV